MYLLHASTVGAKGRSVVLFGILDVIPPPEGLHAECSDRSTKQFLSFTDSVGMAPCSKGTKKKQEACAV